MSVHLFDLADGRKLGTLTDDQFQFLADHLETEDADDDDYYLNEATLASLRDAGTDPQVLGLLQTALAGRGEMDIRWQRQQDDATGSPEAATE